MPDQSEMTNISSKPLVTVAVMTFNQEAYIIEALESAVAQKYRPLEVIVSDDCSTDRTVDLVQEWIRNNPTDVEILLRVNGTNLGVSRHFSEIISDAAGDVVVYMPGDDISDPDRVSTCMAIFEKNSNVNLVEVGYLNFSCPDFKKDVCEQPMFDLDRNISSLAVFSLCDYISGKAPPLASCARAIRKESFLKFPPLNSSCPSDDTPTILRCLMSGNGAYLPDCLVWRRIHECNVTGLSAMANISFQNILDQYIADIEWSVFSGLIKQNYADKLITWAKLSIERRELRRTIEAKRSNFDFLLRVILPSNALSFREKMWAVKKSLFI